MSYGQKTSTHMKQRDSYGRQFYMALGGTGQAERVFTPLPLDVVNYYSFYPITDPVRVHPILFPFDPQ